jgi:hypothetical protein
VNFGLGGKKHGRGNIIIIIIEEDKLSTRERWRTPRRTGSLRTRRRRGAPLQQGYVYHFSPHFFWNLDLS